MNLISRLVIVSLKGGIFMDEQIQNPQNVTPPAPPPEDSKPDWPSQPSTGDEGNMRLSPTPVISGAGSPKKKMWIVVAIVVILLLLLGVGAWFWLHKKENQKQSTAKSSNKTTLVIAVHWLEDQQINGIKGKDGKLQSKGLQQYLDEYVALHPEIQFNVQQIPYDEYADKLKVLNDSGTPPDIYQIYSAWGASYVRNGILAEPPADIQADIEKNYVSAAGPTIDGKVWGIPTEINNYALLYNKDLFKQAGIVDAQGNAKAPTTWAEVLADAKKLTKRDSKGAITQYGFAFLRDNDWQAVDPFLSLLFTNGGEYLSGDLKKALFNSAAGVQALDAEVQLFKDGSTDTAGNFYDFGKGTVGIVVSPPWTKANFAEAFGDKFGTTVGVAPLPYLKNPATLQYGWFTGVMKDSAHQQEAWDFLKWFTSEAQSSGTTRYGDLLANTIGAIPAPKVDFEKHKDVLGDFFTSVYVQQMKDSKAEPNVLQSSDIKAALMTEIQAAWDGTKTSQQALDSAAATINKILEQNYH
jgi:multiple sugar transport system substrate-binding protein